MRTNELIAVGTEAPDFSLPASDGRTYRLTDALRERTVLLVFYPGDNTPGCNRQLSTIRDHIASFEEAGVKPFGVNPASVERHARYAAKFEFPFPLLSDGEREVSRRYGAVRFDGVRIHRSVVLIGRDGVVRFAARGAPRPEDLLAAVPGGSPGTSARR